MRLISFLIIFQLLFPIGVFAQSPTATPSGDDDDENVELDDKQKAMLDKLMEKNKSFEKRKAEAESLIKDFVAKQNKLSGITKEGEIEESGYKQKVNPSVVDPVDNKLEYWRGNYPITLESNQLKGITSNPEIHDYIVNYIISHPNFDDIEGIYQVNFGNTCSVPVSFADKAAKKTYLTQLPYNSDVGKAFFDQLASVYKPGEEEDDPEVKPEQQDTFDKSSILTHWKYFAPKNTMINKSLHEGKISQSSKKKNGVRVLKTEVIYENPFTLIVDTKSAPAKATVELFAADLLKDNKEESVYAVSPETQGNAKAALLAKVAELEKSGKEVKVLGAVCNSSASRISVAYDGSFKVGSTPAGGVYKFKTEAAEQDTFTQIDPKVISGCSSSMSPGCNHKLSALRRVYCMGAVENIVEELRKDKPALVAAKTSMKPKEFDAGSKFHFETGIKPNYEKLITADATFPDKAPFYIFPGSDTGFNLDGTSGYEYYRCKSAEYAKTHTNCAQKDSAGKAYEYPPKKSSDTSGNLEKVLKDSSENKVSSDTIMKAVNADYYHEHQFAEMNFILLVKDKPKDPKSKEIKCNEYGIIQLYMDKSAKTKCIVENKKTKEVEIKECSGSTGGKKRKHRKRGGTIIVDCTPKKTGVGDCFSFRNKRPLCTMFKRIVEKIAN